MVIIRVPVQVIHLNMCSVLRVSNIVVHSRRETLSSFTARYRNNIMYSTAIIKLTFFADPLRFDVI